MTYEEKVKQARKDILKVNINQEKEIIKIYEAASKDILRKLSKTKPGGLTDRYLWSMYTSLQEELYEQLRVLSEDVIETSAQIASSVQLSYFENISPNINISNSFKNRFSRISNDVVKRMISGEYYKDKKSLDERIWSITDKSIKDIDTLIKSNILGGANAKDLAKQLEAYVNPKKRMETVPIYAMNKKGKLVKLQPPSGISDNIAYQAQRLARTSLSQSYTETYIQGSKNNPFNIGLKWNLSPSHYERQVKRWGEDVCDGYSNNNSYNLGKGIYPPNSYPVQHPNCLCYPTQENVPIEVARKQLIDWVNGENNPDLDRWMNGNDEKFEVKKNQLKYFSQLDVSKEENSGIIIERNIDERNMANGNRKSSKINLSDKDKGHLVKEIESIKADKSIFSFRDGYGSGYSDERDRIYISSNIFPSEDNSLHPRDLMSERAALAHEYYGHREYRGTKLEKGSWNDEFRASYIAAKNCPNLSKDDRMYLVLDSIERAKEAGVSIKYNDFMRRILYGH